MEHKKVTDMSNLFNSFDKFDADISKWDMTNVTNTNYMFFKCTNFKNGSNSLNSWNMGNVTSMKGMFEGCENFDSDIGKWDTKKVTDMSYMFQIKNLIKILVAGILVMLLILKLCFLKIF